METKIVDNKYYIGEQIGRGGFSKVYKTYTIPLEYWEEANRGNLDIKRLGECSKVIKIATSPEYDFTHEVNVSKNIEDSNGAVKVIDSGKFLQNEDNHTYFPSNLDYTISKHMAGGDMFNALKSKKFNELEIKHLFHEMVEGLSAIHQSGYAHMDIKLGNILLDENDKPHFSDFGLSVRAHSDQTLDGKIYCYKGSRRYIAPEILEKTKFSPFKADIFSLGVCLFMITVGSFSPKIPYPFKAAKEDDKNYKRLFGENPMWFWLKHKAAKHITKFISNDLIDLIVSMLLPDPEARPSLDDIRNHAWLKSRS